MRGKDGQRPRLVHRLDKDTAGCLLVAKTRFAAAALSKTFRSRSARKIYWALVAGVPRPPQGRISTFLAKEEREDESIMRIAKHGDEGASHAVTYYAVVETAARQLAWLSLKPVTGRTHQLRAHMDHIGHPIVGDQKYFRIENWEFPGGMQNRAAPAGATNSGAASARRSDRHHGAVAAAHAAVLEPDRLRRQALRSDRGGAGGIEGRVMSEEWNSFLVAWLPFDLFDRGACVSGAGRACAQRGRPGAQPDRDLRAASR